MKTPTAIRSSTASTNATQTQSTYQPDLRSASRAARRERTVGRIWLPWSPKWGSQYVRTVYAHIDNCGVGMNRVDRRQGEQLLSQELALLKSCGSEIRKTDYEALSLARLRSARHTTPTERFFKVRWTLRTAVKAIARWTADLRKPNAAR